MCKYLKNYFPVGFIYKILGYFLTKKALSICCICCPRYQLVRWKNRWFGCYNQGCSRDKIKSVHNRCWNPTSTQSIESRLYFFACACVEQVVMPQSGGSNRLGFRLVFSNSRKEIYLDGVFNIISYDVVPKLSETLLKCHFKVNLKFQLHNLSCFKSWEKNTCQYL